MNCSRECLLSRQVYLVNIFRWVCYLVNTFGKLIVSFWVSSVLFISAYPLTIGCNDMLLSLLAYWLFFRRVDFLSSFFGYSFMNSVLFDTWNESPNRVSKLISRSKNPLNNFPCFFLFLYSSSFNFFSINSALTRLSSFRILVSVQLCLFVSEPNELEMSSGFSANLIPSLNFAGVSYEYDLITTGSSG